MTFPQWNNSIMVYKLVILSDIHHDLARVRAILPILNEADYVIFCGDGIEDIMYFRNALRSPLVCVRGNNDFGTNITETAVSTFGNTRALVTHGHKFDVRNGLKALYFTAMTDKCRMVFFGHTHTFTDKIVQGVHFINPGALCMGSYSLGAGDGTNIAVKQCLVQ